MHVEDTAVTDPGPADTTSAAATPATAPTAYSGVETSNGRPEAPDVGPGTVHVPGQAPGQHILTGPASMTVGARRSKSNSRKKS